MSTFQVPQFIEEKPKIIGPLTLVQFFYIAGAGAIILITRYVFNLFFWIVFSAAIAAIGAALAFIKINGQTLPGVALSAFRYLWQPRTYTWQRTAAAKKSGALEIEKIEAIRKSAGLGEKIKSLALGVLTRKTPSIRTGGEREKYQVVTFMSGEKRLAKKVDY